MEQTQGFILILDISGYTRFVRSHNLRHIPLYGKHFRKMSEAHAEQVVSDLLETLVKAMGDGVVEFHEVVGAFKAYAKVFYSLLRRRKNVKSGLDGRTIEWRAALYGVLDVLAKVEDPNPNQTLTRP